MADDFQHLYRATRAAYTGVSISANVATSILHTLTLTKVIPPVAAVALLEDIASHARNAAGDDEDLLRLIDERFAEGLRALRG